MTTSSASTAIKVRNLLICISPGWAGCHQRRSLNRTTARQREICGELFALAQAVVVLEANIVGTIFEDRTQKLQGASRVEVEIVRGVLKLPAGRGMTRYCEARRGRPALVVDHRNDHSVGAVARRRTAVGSGDRRARWINFRSGGKLGSRPLC